MVISGRAYKDMQRNYEASTDKYHTYRRLATMMAANAWNYLSLTLGLQNTAYYGTEFNNFADSLYSLGLVQSVTLQDLSLKAWTPDASLPIQRPRVLKIMHENTSAEVDCQDVSTLFHNAQAKAPLLRIRHFLSPDASEDTPLE
eukprot:2436574-Karenia_brevis.AAC.1